MNERIATAILVATLIIATIGAGMAAYGTLAPDKSNFEAGVAQTLSTIELATRSQEVVPISSNNATAYCMSQATLQNVINKISEQSTISPN